LRPLPLHRFGKSFLIDRYVAIAADVLGQIQREAVGVVQLESHFAVERAGAAGQLRVEHFQAVFQRAQETRFFVLDDLGDVRRTIDQFGVGVFHRFDHRAADPVQERLLQADQHAVARRAPHDAPQDVAAALVGGQHAVADEEGYRADMIGDDPHAHGRLRVFAVDEARQALGFAVNGRKQIGIVVGVLALQHRRKPFEPGAGVDRRPRQRGHHAGRVAVELHEHEVPQLEVAVAVVDRSREPRPLIVQNFAARTAGAGVAHRPEVVLFAEADDPVGRHAHFRAPQRRGFVVVAEHGDPQLGRVELVDFGQQLPAEADGIALEVVAEAEIAQHFEERVMARGASDVLEVVVFARHAQALLAGGGAAGADVLFAQKDAFKLHHPGVGEQQRGILLRHQRRTGQHLVPVFRKVIEKRLADFIAGHRDVSCLPLAEIQGVIPSA